MNDGLVRNFNALLVLIEDHLAHLEGHLRSRGITPPQHDLMTEFTERLRALRIDTPKPEAA